ncbi:MAG: ABC transporter permease [Bacteroidota bacterium]
MLLKIIKFELKSRFTQWMTLLFVLMMLFQGVWYTKGFYDYYGGDGMNINSPGVFYQNLAGCGLLMVIVIAIITGPMLYKDIQYKSAGWLYALPMNDKQFFLSRFIAAFLVNVIIGFFYLLGMLLVPYAGIGTPDLIGPSPVGQMLHGFVLLTITNLFLLTAICFGALAIFKKPAVGYLAIFITVISFLMMQTNSESSGFSTMNLLGDAFAYVAVNQQVTEMSILERNTSYIDFSGTLLLNRVLWLGIALVVFIIGYLKFSFKDFLTAGQSKKSKMADESTTLSTKNKRPAINFIPNLSYQTGDFLRKLTTLSVLEFKNIVRPSGFRIIVGIMIIMAVLQNLIWNANYYIGPQVPITSGMTNFRISNGVFIVLLLIIWSGELFFKDRVVNIWQITDALPVPIWVTQLSKLLAMFGVAFVINLTFMLSGVFAQVVKGGISTLDVGLFINDYFGYNWGWLNHCLYISLTFFVAGLSGNRFLTHILTAGYFFMLIVCFEFGIMEELRYGFGFTPGFEDYSEMNGYGMWKGASFWYFLNWAVLAIAIILLGILFWDRGLTKSIFKKLTFKSKQLNVVGKLAIPVLLVGFFFLQSFISQETAGKDNFETDESVELTKADYERTYGYLRDLPQPKYSQQLDLKVDFQPLNRSADYQITTRISNSTATTIDTIFLNLAENTRLLELTYQGRVTTSYDYDPNHEVVTFVLPTPLDTNAVADLTLKMEKGYEGFTQGDPQAALVYDGSFASIDEYLPFLGYDPEKQLEKNRTRAEMGMERLTSLLPEVTDKTGLQNDGYRADALPLTANITISTVETQTPIGPGQLTKSWTENGRNHTLFNINETTPLYWHLGTAPYNVDEAVNNTVHYFGDHRYNVAMYQSILQRGQSFLQEKLGSYPHKQVRLYQIPRYEDAVYAFPNGIAINELEGWLADTSGLKERAYLNHTIVTSLAQHWLQANLAIANVQGADMLKIALPEALSLQFVQQTYGDEAVELLLAQKIKLYNRERFNDPNGEPPLLYADGKDYLEANAGALALYDWSRAIGFDKFNDVVRGLVDVDDSLTFEDLYEQLLAVSDKQAEWKRRMEEVAD